MTLALTFKNGTAITWQPGDDGGGSNQYLDFISILREKRYNKCLEWCAGLSAITFSLFDENVINEAVLVDIYEPALKTAMINAKNNNLDGKLKYYICDKVKDIPLNEKFDLVVANPPHSCDYHWMADGPDKQTSMRLTIDEGWQIHKEFYANITGYLNTGADIFISEVCIDSRHLAWAKEVGLNFIEAIPANELSNNSKLNAVILHFKYET